MSTEPEQQQVEAGKEPWPSPVRLARSRYKRPAEVWQTEYRESNEDFEVTRYYSEEKVSALVSAANLALAELERLQDVTCSEDADLIEQEIQNLSAALADFQKGDNDAG